MIAKGGGRCGMNRQEGMAGGESWHDIPLIRSLMDLDGMAIKSSPQAGLLGDVAEFEVDFRFSAPG